MPFAVAVVIFFLVGSLTCDWGLAASITTAFATLMIPIVAVVLTNRLQQSNTQTQRSNDENKLDNERTIEENNRIKLEIELMKQEIVTKLDFDQTKQVVKDELDSIDTILGGSPGSVFDSYSQDEQNK